MRLPVWYFGNCNRRMCDHSFNGLKALVKLRANADSAIAIATVVIAIQSVVLLFMQDALAAGECTFILR